MGLLRVLSKPSTNVRKICTTTGMPFKAKQLSINGIFLELRVSVDKEVWVQSFERSWRSGEAETEAEAEGVGNQLKYWGATGITLVNDVGGVILKRAQAEDLEKLM